MREFNPQLIDALCRLGQQATEAQGAFSAWAAELLERVLESVAPNSCGLKWQPLVDKPRHVVREVLTLLWRRQNWPRQRMSFDHWDRLAGILLAGGAGDFPDGLSAHRSGRLLIIAAGGPLPTAVNAPVQHRSGASPPQPRNAGTDA
jgi:tRNA(Ile)-lysidine synthase